MKSVTRCIWSLSCRSITVPQRALSSMKNIQLPCSHFSSFLFLSYYFLSLNLYRFMPSAVWRCWFGNKKTIRPVRIECWYVGGGGTGCHYLRFCSSLAAAQSRMVTHSGTGLAADYRGNWPLIRVSCFLLFAADEDKRKVLTPRRRAKFCFDFVLQWPCNN